jgi:hypothetical protein
MLRHLFDPIAELINQNKITKTHANVTLYPMGLTGGATTEPTMNVFHNPRTLETLSIVLSLASIGSIVLKLSGSNEVSGV